MISFDVLRYASEFYVDDSFTLQDAFDLGRRVEAREQDDRADAVALRVVQALREPGAGDRPLLDVQAPVLVRPEEAAQMLGITVSALYSRVARHQLPGVVRTGRRLQFHRARLLEGLGRRAKR